MYRAHTTNKKLLLIFLLAASIQFIAGAAHVLAKELASHFEQQNIFIRVNSQGWTINYPEFVTTVPGDPL